MVYTVITGFIELPYEQTLVPGVLITTPKKILIIAANSGLIILMLCFKLLAQEKVYLAQ